MNARRCALLLVAALLASAAPALAAPPAPKPPRVHAELVSELSTIAPGASFWVALRQKIAPGWHTYWENPGDSGEPATIEWRLPAGFTAGPIVWPHPERIPNGPFMGFGYTDEVLLLTRVTAPAALAPGAEVAIRANAGWLVCEDECIPEEAAVSVTLPVAAQPAADPRWAKPIARTLRAVPAASPWPAQYDATSEAIMLHVGAPGLSPERIVEVSFYPREWGVLEHAAPQRATVSASGIRLEIGRGAQASPLATPVDGVLVVKERLDDGVASQAFAIRATPRGGADGTTLARAIGLAFLGGLVLNLMPCVLPVLSVKALALVHHAAAAPAETRRHGLAYTAGVLASFALLAGALLALRAGGEQIGWGFQLQSPLFVTILAYVLFVLALSLSGVVTIGARLTGVGNELAARPGYGGSFLAGALATVAATPCTAPFMGVAVGFAVTQSATTALLVFEALALGLALPFLALSLIPRWARVLPEPGRWMTWLKHALAVPLYASVAWLLWVLHRQTDALAVAAAMVGLLLVAAGFRLYDVSLTATTGRRHAATAVAVLAVVAAIAVGQVGATARASTPGAAQAFTPTRLAELRAQGKTVFVNFTAAWCLTCQVNRRAALEAPSVTDAFARKGIVYLEADWTRRDPTITKVLESFGRSGVPLYVIYPPLGAGTAEPVVLPSVLTERVVLDAVGRL